MDYCYLLPAGKAGIILLDHCSCTRLIDAVGKVGLITGAGKKKAVREAQPGMRGDGHNSGLHRAG
jgi:hypothetical protein